MGFGVGWLVFGSGGGSDDRARACASAEELPEELATESEMSKTRIETLNKVYAVGMLAQAAGQDGDGPDDLDELGTAGKELVATINTFTFDRYPDARQALLDAC